MDLSAQKEKFSEAYVLAIAATAGYGTFDTPRTEVTGIPDSARQLTRKTYI